MRRISTRHPLFRHRLQRGQDMSVEGRPPRWHAIPWKTPMVVRGSEEWEQAVPNPRKTWRRQNAKARKDTWGDPAGLRRRVKRANIGAARGICGFSRTESWLIVNGT